ncbi:MAG: hypothetical protein ACLPVY_01655 [Acidimicrobiia bacterium]
MNSDLRAIVECLLTAHYSDVEIVDYLKGPLGLTEHEAVCAVRDAAGLSVAETDDPSAV